MKFKINWQEVVGYYTIINASSKEEALEKFHKHGPDADDVVETAADGFCEMQDSIEVEDDPV